MGTGGLLPLRHAYNLRRVWSDCLGFERVRCICQVFFSIQVAYPRALGMLPI